MAGKPPILSSKILPSRLSLRWTLAGTFLFLAFLPVSHSAGQETESGALRVEDAVMAAGVENLTPVGVGTVFPVNNGKVYCFTRIITDSYPTRVKHLWHQGDQFVMEIVLPVNSPNWRTYSSKTLTPSSRGNWRVAVTSEDGTVLENLIFAIE